MKLFGPLFFLFALAGQSGAQTTPAADTTDTRPGAEVGLGTMVTKDGRRIRAYVPNGAYSFASAFGYYLTSPKQHPIPKVQIMRVEQLRSLSIRGRYYETIYFEGDKAPWYMALRLCEGPVELFALPATDNIPGPMPWSRRETTAEELKQQHNLPKSNWLIRRRGRQLEPVSHGRFQQQIGDYLRDYAELSQHVRKGDQNYRYQDLPYLVDEYNRWLLSRPTPAGR